MRAFKTLTLVCLFFYLIAAAKPNISNVYFGWQNYEKEFLYDQLDKANTNEPRIVIFGSSHCEVGLRSKDISNAIHYKTFNFCHTAYDSEENFAKLLSHLNKNDYLIYAKRAIFQRKTPYLLDEEFLEKFPLKSLLPYSISTVRTFRLGNHLAGGENYLPSGDLASYSLPQKFDYPSYKFDLKVFNDNLDSQLKKIFQKKFDIQPKLIIITAPLLVKEKSAFNFTQVEPHCATCANFREWVPPLLLDNKDYFYEALHVNAKGADLWTNYLILEMQKIKNADQKR